LKILLKNLLTNLVIYFIITKSVEESKRKTKTTDKKLGILAQLGEHLPYKQRVTGSSPVGPTLLKRRKIS
jgi:hypothetical protein